MDLVQRMNGNNNKFAQLTQSMSCPWYCMWVDRVVDVVFDVYHQQPSIKDSERLNRRAITTLQYKSLARGHNSQQWRQFLFLQQDEPHQVRGWRVDTTAIQRYAARQGIVGNLQDEGR